MDLAFSKWYPLPYELAMWEVCEAVGQAKLKTVYCDPVVGRLMAESKTKTIDVGLIYIQLEIHPESGTTVSLMGEPYMSAFKDSLNKPFNQLLWAIDYRIVTRANHFAATLKQTAEQGVKVDLTKGTDLSSRKKEMRRPRAYGAIILTSLVAGLFLFLMVLQDTTFEMMIYLAIASPFIISAGLIAIGQFQAGGWIFALAGFGVGVFFLVFTGLLSVIILLPALKGTTRAFSAEAKRTWLGRPPEMTHSVSRPIVIEHR